MRYHEASRQGLGLILAAAFAIVANPTPITLFPAAVLVIIGVGIRLWASGFIIKNAELATHGPYAFVRHPLYVGNILIVFAFAAASGFWWPFLVVFSFLGFYYPTAIEYEDRKLATLFGNNWFEYAKHTPALLPNFSRRDRKFSGSWSLKKSLAGNLELVVTIYLLACFAYICLQL